MICNSALHFDTAHALLDMAALLKPMMCQYPIVFWQFDVRQLFCLLLVSFKNSWLGWSFSKIWGRISENNILIAFVSLTLIYAKSKHSGQGLGHCPASRHGWWDSSFISSGGVLAWQTVPVTWHKPTGDCRCDWIWSQCHLSWTWLPDFQKTAK